MTAVSEKGKVSREEMLGKMGLLHAEFGVCVGTIKWACAEVSWTL